jgi:hypothetical protein
MGRHDTNSSWDSWDFGACADFDGLAAPQKPETESTNLAKSVGELQQSSDEAVDVECEDIYRPFDLPASKYSPRLLGYSDEGYVSCQRISNKIPNIDLDGYALLRGSLENHESSQNISTAWPANSKQNNKSALWAFDDIFNRPQDLETLSADFREAVEKASAISIPPEVDYSLPTQPNCTDGFVTDETVSSESSTPGNEDSSNTDALLFSFKKHELLQNLMTTFYTQLSTKGFITSVYAGGSTRSSGSSAGREATSQSQGRTENQTLKRRRDTEGLPPGDWGDRDGMRKGSLKSLLEPETDDSGRRFACPFFKYDPNIYSKVGSCIGPGFASVSRVKFVYVILIYKGII